MAPVPRYPSSGWGSSSTRPGSPIRPSKNLAPAPSSSAPMSPPHRALPRGPIAIAIGLYLSLLAPAGGSGNRLAAGRDAGGDPQRHPRLLGAPDSRSLAHEHLEPFLRGTPLGFLPIFGTPSRRGLSLFTAGLILTIMVIPIIASISRDLFLTVPEEMQDGGACSGGSRWEVVRGVVLPARLGAWSPPTLLGLGRALGEAIAVVQVSGDGSRNPTGRCSNPATRWPPRIANQFLNASPGIYQSSLFYLGVILFVIGLAFEPRAPPWIGRRFDPYQRGGR